MDFSHSSYNLGDCSLDQEFALKTLFFLSLGLFISTSGFCDSFEADAQKLAADLRLGLVKNLSQKIEQEGVVNAVAFCHENVKALAQSAAGERRQKFDFGRTSHKLRNQSNHPQVWAESYLKEFQGKLKSEIKQSSFLIEHDGKRIYLEPLFVEAKCLLCHGDKIGQLVSDKIKSLYPEDQARGFKLGEFRGFIWVREK